jgi:hypothetical protein
MSISCPAGLVEELVQYKKDVLYNERRDPRIHGSIEATLDFISERRSRFLNNLSSRAAIWNPAVDSASVPVAVVLSTDLAADELPIRWQRGRDTRERDQK